MTRSFEGVGVQIVFDWIGLSSFRVSERGASWRDWGERCSAPAQPATPESCATAKLSHAGSLGCAYEAKVLQKLPAPILTSRRTRSPPYSRTRTLRFSAQLLSANADCRCMLLTLCAC